MLKHSFKKDVKSFPVLRQKTTILISSYWMRLSRMWRIMQIEETVWITASEICVILHIIRKLDSIIVLLFIPNISKFFTSLPPCRLSPKQVSLFLDTVPRYGVFTWRHGGHLGVPKQWNGGHVGVPNQTCGSGTLFLCKRFLLFR